MADIAMRLAVLAAFSFLLIMLAGCDVRAEGGGVSEHEKGLQIIITREIEA